MKIEEKEEEEHGSLAPVDTMVPVVWFYYWPY